MNDQHDEPTSPDPNVEQPGGGAAEPGPPPPPPPVEPVAEPTQDEKTMALLAHLLGIFTGFIGCLVIWLVKKDESAFVDDQGKEALNFQITVMIAIVAAWLLTFVCIGFILLPAAAIANVVFCILAAVESNKGVAYRYPVTLRLIK